MEGLCRAFLYQTHIDLWLYAYLAPYMNPQRYTFLVQPLSDVPMVESKALSNLISSPLLNPI